MPFVPHQALWLICVLWFQDPPATQVEKFPSIRPVQGDLHVWRSGAKKVETVEKDTPVTPDDRIGSKDGKSVVFMTEGNTLITLKSVRVDATKGVSLSLGRSEKDGKPILIVKIVEGTLVLDSYEARINIETEHGKITGENLFVLVEADKKKTRVVPFDGEPTVTNKLGSQRVPPGKATVLKEDESPSIPKPTTESFSESLPNLVQNPGFERDLEFWTTERDPILNDYRITHSGRDGTKALQLKVSSEVYPGRRADALPGWQDIKVTPGRRYIARVYIRMETRKGDITPRLQIEQKGVTSLWDWADCEKEWALARLTFVAEKDVCTIRVRTTNRKDDYDVTLTIDDFKLIEIPKR